MSRAPKSTRAVRLGLALVCAALGAGLYDQWQSEISVSLPTKRVAAPNPKPSPAIARNPAQFPALVDLGIVVERPLFDKTRRPAPDDEIIAAPTSQEPATQFQLEGVVVSGRERLAVLRVGGKAQTVRVGYTVNGWRVDEIGYSAIVLSRGARKQKLEMVRAPVPIRRRTPVRTPKKTR